MNEVALVNTLIVAVQLNTVSGTDKSHKRLLAAVSAVLEKMLGRKPTKEEIAAAIG